MLAGEVGNSPISLGNQEFLLPNIQDWDSLGISVPDDLATD